MKKIVTLSLVLALGTPLFAERLQIFRCSEDGIPGRTDPQLMGLSISANGRYICGAIEQGAGIFTADCLTGEVKWKVCGEAESELRSVDNNGLAIGYIDDDGVLFSFDTEDASFIEAPAGIRYVQGESLSNDGSVMVGSFTAQSFHTEAAYSVGDEGWKKLPYPTDTELGNLKDKINSLSAAKFVSGDGSVIVGYLGSFTFPIIWTRNAEGEYVLDFFPARFVKADSSDDSKELYGISGVYTCMSNNGKYVATIGLIINEENTDTRVVPIVYNTEDKTLKIYKERQDIDEMEVGLYPRAIADDGTFVGTVSSPSDPAGNFGAFIMKEGHEQADWFVEEFPVFNEELGESDILGLNIPTGISADGQHILGYTFYSKNYDLTSDDPAYYLTYVISLVDSGVDQLAPSVEYNPHSIYSIDGRKLDRISKGLNIVRDAEGKVRKILK